MQKNYRPISVLLVVARIFEKLIFDHLCNYLSKNNVIYCGQSFYSRLHSTGTFLMKSTEKIV